jgi:hypothetical protein
VPDTSARARASSAPRTTLVHHPQRGAAAAAALHLYTNRPSPALFPVLSPRALQQGKRASHVPPLTPSTHHGFGFVLTLPLGSISVLGSCL